MPLSSQDMRIISPTRESYPERTYCNVYSNLKCFTDDAEGKAA